MPVEGSDEDRLEAALDRIAQAMASTIGAASPNAVPMQAGPDAAALSARVDQLISVVRGALASHD